VNTFSEEKHQIFILTNTATTFLVTNSVFPTWRSTAIKRFHVFKIARAYTGFFFDVILGFTFAQLNTSVVGAIMSVAIHTYTILIDAISDLMLSARFQTFSRRTHFRSVGTFTTIITWDLIARALDIILDTRFPF
jgi:hypothetical protein